MPCAGCAKKRAMMKSEYQVVKADGTSLGTYTSLRDAQSTASRNRGARVLAVPKAPA